MTRKIEGLRKTWTLTVKIQFVCEDAGAWGKEIDSDFLSHRYNPANSNDSVNDHEYGQKKPYSGGGGDSTCRRLGIFPEWDGCEKDGGYTKRKLPCLKKVDQKAIYFWLSYHGSRWEKAFEGWMVQQ